MDPPFHRLLPAAASSPTSHSAKDTEHDYEFITSMSCLLRPPLYFHTKFCFLGANPTERLDSAWRNCTTPEFWGMEGQGCLLDTNDTSHQRWDPQPALPNPLVHAMVQILMIEPDKTRAGIPTSQRSINQHT